MVLDDAFFFWMTVSVKNEFERTALGTPHDAGTGIFTELYEAVAPADLQANVI